LIPTTHRDPNSTLHTATITTISLAAGGPAIKLTARATSQTRDTTPIASTTAVARSSVTRHGGIGAPVSVVCAPPFSLIALRSASLPATRAATSSGAVASTVWRPRSRYHAPAAAYSTIVGTITCTFTHK